MKCVNLLIYKHHGIYFFLCRRVDRCLLNATILLVQEIVVHVLLLCDYDLSFNVERYQANYLPKRAGGFRVNKIGPVVISSVQKIIHCGIVNPYFKSYHFLNFRNFLNFLSGPIKIEVKSCLLGDCNSDKSTCIKAFVTLENT